MIFLVILLELLRRAQREYDRYISTQPGSIHGHGRLLEGGSSAIASSDDIGKTQQSPSMLRRGHGQFGMAKFKPNLLQQAVRSLLFMLQFAVGYFVMLLAM